MRYSRQAGRTTVETQSVSRLARAPGVRVGEYVPALGQAVAEYHARAATLVDPTILALCRWRIAQIVDETSTPFASEDLLSAAQLRDLADWRASPHFDAAQRACLELAEYFCYAPQSVTDAHVAAVLEHLPAEHVLALTVALWVTDGSERLANFLTAVLPPEDTDD
jgi:hypothetical protein